MTCLFRPLTLDRLHRLPSFIGALLIWGLMPFYTAHAAGLVMFNEIHYHPPSNEAAFEWVEFFNAASVDVDLSGWSVSQGVDFRFPQGTVIRAGGYLLLASSPKDLAGLTGLTNVAGPFAGKLSNNGELLELHDSSGRTMDSVKYGIDGDWPAGADGSGFTLMKRRPLSDSTAPGSWTVSLQAGGSPGAINNPQPGPFGPSVPVFTWNQSWRFNDSGIDPGLGWRQPAFIDAAWTLGSGVFYSGNPRFSQAPGAVMTSGRTTDYFRTSFNVAGDPSSLLFTFRELLDDGAVCFVNGVEVSRVNMPAGSVVNTTAAVRPAGSAFLTPWLSIPSSNLVAGSNSIAVELHQSPASPGSSLKITPAAGIKLSWDTEEGNYFSPEDPAPAPDNDAALNKGTELLVSSNPGSAVRLTDGLYGNSSSWSPAASDTTPFVILRFQSPRVLFAVAWSRDNGNARETSCGGTCIDRSLGSYVMQYTLATNVTASLTNASNPTNGWVNLGTVLYASATAGFIPSLRHQFNLATSNDLPLLATAMRLRTPTGVTLDELELNPPASPGFHAAFGMELSVASLRPPPPSLVFNEIAPASASTFWLEIQNVGSSAVDLDGCAVMRSGVTLATHAFGHQILASGEIHSFTRTELGFGTAEGNKLFLYSPDRVALLDTVTVRKTSRARYPDGTGDWMTPTPPTPGASNRVILRDGVVINEMMHHAPPFDRVPAVLTETIMVGLRSGGWRYDDSGNEIGESWRMMSFNDASWTVGAGDFALKRPPPAASAATTLASGPITYRFRKRFNFTGDLTRASLQLRSIVDDGAVYYLNGIEIYRANMPSGVIDANTSAITPVSTPTLSAQIPLSATSLIVGENVLAVEVHQSVNALASSGVDLQGSALTLIDEGPVGAPVPDNLARAVGVKPFVIDSLSGFPIHDYLHINDGIYGNSHSWIGNSGNPGYVGLAFGSTQSVYSIAFGRDNTGQGNDRTLGLYTLQYTQVQKPGPTTTATGSPSTGWATLGTLNYLAAGEGLFARPSVRHHFQFSAVDATGIRLIVPQTGISSGTCIDELEVNSPAPIPDLAFDLELKATITESPGSPYALNDEEWVELYNRSGQSIDVSGWQIDGGIRFSIPTGVQIPADGYLVVARHSADLKALWPEVASRIVGDFSGKLSEGESLRLLDAVGNPVHQAIVHSGPWSDGGGSSSELVDPRSDADVAESWRDRDESARASWQTISYRMIAGQKFGNTFWNEFRLGFLAPGVAWIDDVKVIRDPDGVRQSLIQNGDFESKEANPHWRLLGDHSTSQIIVDPTDAANHVLRMSATSPARTSHNHVESTFVGNTPIVDGKEYEVSFRARWVSGSPQIQSGAYHQRLAKSTLLMTPLRHGTPGAPNSRRSANIGPTFSGLRHLPVVPKTNEPVNVSVRIADPDGIASVTLNYRLNRSNVFNALPMSLQTDGNWGATLPSQSAGKVVQFYVSAVDTLGASNTAPALGAASRALYQVADNQGTKLPLHEVRLIQLDSERTFLLHFTNVMSQERLGGTVIYDRSEVFYDCGVRLHGSAASRARDGDDFVSYDIEFPSARPFRGVQSGIVIDRSGRSPVTRNQDEFYVLHMFHRAGIVCHHDDLCYFIAPFTTHTGTGILQLGAYDSRFVSEQFMTDGTVYNFDGTYEPSVTDKGGVEGLKLAVPLLNQESTDLTDLGSDPEQYRVAFDIRHGERRDDFSSLRRLGQTFDLPQAEFEKSVASALDVDEAMRVSAMTILCGIGDIYLSPVPSFPHNLRLWTPADGGPAAFLPWDMDFVFYLDPNESIFPTSSAHLSKLVGSPGLRRRYLWHVSDLCNTAFHPSYMGPWMTHLGSVVGQSFTDNLSYIQTRRNAALSQMPATQPFLLKSPSVSPVLITSGTEALLEGTAGLDLNSIRLVQTGLELPIVWTTVTNWRVRVGLMLGMNTIAIEGRDRSGGVLGSAQVSAVGTVLGGGRDTDGDGMPDAWEEVYHLDVLSKDANQDADGDGRSNFDEYRAGTNPSDAASVLSLQVSGITAEGVTLRFQGRAGRSYSVMWREEIGGSGWHKLRDEEPQIADRVVEITAPGFESIGQRFYQVVTPRQP